MPIHDWTRVRANRFHDFHQSWTIRIKDALNAGLLPEDYVAMAEQITGGLPVAAAPPRMRVTVQADATRYSQRANRVNV